MTTAVLVLSAISAQAGPLRNAVANWRASRGGCGTCQPATAAPVQYQPAPAVTMPVVAQTSYAGVGVPVDATPYQPIRLTRPLPVCSPDGCGR